MKTSSVLSRTALFILVVVAVLLATARLGEAQSLSSQWSRPIDITQPSSASTGQFSLMLCDPYQNLHIFWSDIDPKGAALYYRTDMDGTWSTPVDVVMQPEHNVLRMSGAISAQTDMIHMLWVDMYLGGNLYYSQAPLRSARDPRAWSTPVILASNTNAGSIVIDKDGVLHVVYDAGDSDGRQLAIEYIQSKDDGLSWSDPKAAFTTNAPMPSAISGSIAADEAGRLHLGITIRSQDYGVYSEVGYVRSVDSGQTWSAYQRFQDKGTSFTGVSTMAPFAFGKNEIHLTWHDPRRMHSWSNDGGETWSVPIEIMPLGAAFGGQNQLVKDSAGTLHAIVATGGGVYSASWAGNQWGPPEQIDDRPIDPHGQTIVACQGNQLHAAYYDRVGDERVWYSRRDVNAPHIDRRPLPTPQPVIQVIVEPTPTPIGFGRPQSIDGALNVQLPKASSVNPVVVAIIPVAALILIAMGLRRRR